MRIEGTCEAKKSRPNVLRDCLLASALCPFQKTGTVHGAENMEMVPNVPSNPGLVPATFLSQVQHSTDWANRAPLSDERKKWMSIYKQFSCQMTFWLVPGFWRYGPGGWQKGHNQQRDQNVPRLAQGRVQIQLSFFFSFFLLILF